MAVSTPTIQELLEAGVHFGHKVSRGNPRMKGFIFGAREGVHIIDLAFSEEKLKEATQAAYEMGKVGKTMLIVGTKKQAQDIVKDAAEKVGAYYIHHRWPGGLLTNFEELRKNFNRLNALKKEQEEGKLSRYTKKEQLLISRKLDKFAYELGGVAEMNQLPDVLFVIDAVSDYIAVKEANKVAMTVIGLCDSNANPDWFDFPVPANDDGIKSIRLITDTLITAFSQGQKEGSMLRQANAVEQAKKETEPADATKAPTNKEAPVSDDQTALIEEQVEKQILEEVSEEAAKKKDEVL